MHASYTSTRSAAQLPPFVVPPPRPLGARRVLSSAPHATRSVRALLVGSHPRSSYVPSPRKFRPETGQIDGVAAPRDERDLARPSRHQMALAARVDRNAAADPIACRGASRSLRDRNWGPLTSQQGSGPAIAGEDRPLLISPLTCTDAHNSAPWPT
jgi:hypothetical protein